MSATTLTADACKNILFVRLPPFLGYKNHHPRDITLPFAIAYSATMVQETGRKVTIFDLWAHEEKTLEECVEDIKGVDPDVIFFECTAAATPLILRCAEKVKEFSQARLVSFGSVPTFNPEKVLGPDHPFEVGLTAECESTVLDVLDAFDNGTPFGDLLGVSYWDGEKNEMARTKERPLRRDLDEMPLIDYDLLDMDAYYMYSYPMPVFKKVKWGQMLASRGCPYPCTHCSFDHRQTFGRPFRTLSPSRVVDNMEHLINNYGVNAISIEDDCFSFKRKFAVSVAEEIIARGLKVKWVAQTRVDLVDPELLTLLKKAGCVGLSYGIESGNDRILKVLKKCFTKQHVVDGIKMTQDHGFMMRLLFMIGMPSETEEEILETIEVAKDAKSITIQVHLCTPYPGTSLMGEEFGDGKHINDFSSYDKIVHNMSAVSDDKLWALQNKFYRDYYFSFSYFKTFMRQRMLYITGSWQKQMPLLFKALFYLVWRPAQPQQRDTDNALSEATNQ
jgi:radical SAM superfamily enzyme YgiQ (UPF0313 family)